MQGLDYQQISSFKERPSQNIRYLINRQLPRLVENAISQALQFINTGQTKAKALQQLKYTVLIAESSIEKHLERILKALVKIWQLEIENVENTVKQIMKIVGYYVKSNYYIPLMISLLKQDQIKNSPKNTIILLTLIGFMLQTSQDIEAHVPQILSIMAIYENQFIQNDDGLVTILHIANTLAQRLTNFEDPNLVSRLFSILLNVQSTHSIADIHRKQAHQSMQLLAQKCGYSSIAELHSNQVGPVLQNIIESKQYVNWTKTSKNRFKFDTIVRNCQGEAKRFMNDILTVIEYSISLQCDIEIRMDILVLLEELISQKQLQPVIRENGLRIMRKILNVAIKWKVGKPQIKIRKAGVINMIKLIENELIGAEELVQALDQVLPNIKTCISDDWAPELRLACCQFLEKYLMATRQVIQVDKLKQLYVVLLQRLDDSQDPIRKKITIAINLFFNCKSLKFSPSVSSTLEYMINAIFVHYDDNNPEIRDAINISLRFAAVVDAERVLKSGKANLGRMKHKEQCSELIEYCNELLEGRDL